ncbi:THAP domain-containing protein 6-like [Ornithodoros turicata]|uniref:THAP domain-containing protein 6-like n=1 Tax=Ornithodoros turicata TaxID=34597 RepID=UPI003139B5EE
MAYCCIPLCRSDSKKKPPGVSFHEIPADIDTRKQWLKRIKRDNWVRNATSNYSKVCSWHFTNTDFVEGKRRRLKKGALPPVFPDYPSHLQPRQISNRGNSSIRKRKLANDTRGIIDSAKRIKFAQNVALPEEEFKVDQTLSMDTDTVRFGLKKG